VILDDVVLHQWIDGPSIQRNVDLAGRSLHRNFGEVVRKLRRDSADLGMLLGCVEHQASAGQKVGR
jgi:hypothetical protein